MQLELDAKYTYNVKQDCFRCSDCEDEFKTATYRIIVKTVRIAQIKKKIKTDKFSLYRLKESHDDSTTYTATLA